MEDKEAIDNAWKIHAAQAEWTGKVDAKASFAFGLESAAIVTVVALSAKGRIFGDLSDHAAAWLYGIGLALLLIGALFAVTVVIPRLKSDLVKSSAPDNFIYFGHAQHWEPDDLAVALREREILPVIGRQIIVMADIAWQKHRWVQLSMFTGCAGGACIVLSALVLRFL
ncbi:Pycsar system effector family protein [Pseudarthrobacter sp. NPDC058196]|uniref:Pycsar system effector family protein n=1 Tax=Pseudarthrobacter sp. NPDC058196 TaxID=3346376 RepID=UPI0036DE9907